MIWRSPEFLSNVAQNDLLALSPSNERGQLVLEGQDKAIYRYIRGNSIRLFRGYLKNSTFPPESKTLEGLDRLLETSEELRPIGSALGLQGT